MDSGVDLLAKRWRFGGSGATDLPSRTTEWISDVVGRRCSLRIDETQVGEPGKQCAPGSGGVRGDGDNSAATVKEDPRRACVIN